MRLKYHYLSWHRKHIIYHVTRMKWNGERLSKHLLTQGPWAQHYTTAIINLFFFFRLSCQEKSKIAQCTVMNSALLILSVWGYFVSIMFSRAGGPREIGLISRGLFCSDILDKWIRAWSLLSLSIPSLIWSLYSSPASLSLSQLLLSNVRPLLNAYRFSSLVLMSSFY